MPAANFRSKLSFKGIVLGTILALAAVNSGLPALAVGVEIPPDSVKTPPLLPEQSISTFVPSATCPNTPGLAVNIIYPKKARYKDGAPVAVVVPGGIAADGINFNMHAAQVGAIEVRFAFPGGGNKNFGSGGEFDNRGARSVEALKDVILFAAGAAKDYKERSIKDLMEGKVAVSPGNVGLVGWDNGGNAALVALSRYPSELYMVAWLLFYESPVGAMFSPANLGSSADLLTNKHYREGSAATGHILVDYRKLKWSAKAIRNPNRFSGKKRGLPGNKGVLFFDENGNGIWEESIEFACNSLLDQNILKQYFPPQITAAAKRLNLFEEEWPSNLATVQESEEFFSDRDGSLYVGQVAEQYPQLLVGIFASAVDHNQQQPDHPHICFLYNLFLSKHAHWLKLNPDPNYVSAVAAMNVANFVNNKANDSIDASQILSHLEGEGVIPDYLYMDAFVAELADRYKTKNLSVLKQPLAGYVYGSSLALPAKSESAAGNGAAKSGAGAAKN